MRNILQIGFTTEGPTDARFLSNIIQRAFENISFECDSEIEVYPPEFLAKSKDGFVEQILDLAIKYHYFHVICIHCDADSSTINDRMQHNINPAFEAINQHEGVLCKNLVAVIPIQMTEAWMMADLDLLREKMCTTKSNSELTLPVRYTTIENIRDPKECISNALRIAQNDQPRRRKKLNISDLYTPISQELSLENLRNLPSFTLFEENIRIAMRKLNYLR